MFSARLSLFIVLSAVGIGSFTVIDTYYFAESGLSLARAAAGSVVSLAVTGLSAGLAVVAGVLADRYGYLSAISLSAVLYLVVAVGQLASQRSARSSNRQVLAERSPSQTASHSGVGQRRN